MLVELPGVKIQGGERGFNQPLTRRNLGMLAELPGVKIQGGEGDTTNLSQEQCRNVSGATRS